MDPSLLVLTLGVLLFATALNLWLTLRLATRVREQLAPAITVPIGSPVPAFDAVARAEGRPLRSSDMAGRPFVLVFLSAGCKTCAGRVGELAALLPGAERAGVEIWIVPADDAYDIGILVGDTRLADHVLVLDADARLRLNPLKMVPFYLFVDETLVVRASNHIGDENWRAFVGDLKIAA
jgi:peroxiredoxin